MAHVAVTHANFKYFPTLLAYTDYSTTVYNNALQAAQSANTLSPSTMNAYRKERIETWELVPMTINFLKSDSTQLTGTVTLKNVSPTSVYPEDPVEDERTFTISSGSVSAPIYKGHSYEITASFDVTGGQPLVYKVQTLPREKGKKLTYDYFQTPALTDLADPNADAELVFINGQPDAPYNLAADVLAETFTLSWEWVAPSGFQLQHFKVYRGGVEIATTTDQSLQGILVESDNMTYTYTVKAFDVNNNPTPDSRSIEVLPEMTEDLQNYYAWKTQYFGTDPYYDYQDYDGDGLTNYQEYLLGSNPTLAFSENVKSTMSNISPGLHATYYQGDTTTDRISKFLALTPVGTDIVTTFNFAYSANPILTSGLSDYVCAKLEGYLDVPADGQYRFYLTSADGSILYIDDQLAINNDYRHSMREYTKDLYLKAGVHKIRIDFFEYDYSAGLSIEWAGPTFFRREITSSDVWYAPEMSEELEEALAWIVDNDQDGLCNNVEIVHNTDKDNADSDGDGLSDYDEIFTYQTNPNEADSDGDGVSDLVEVTVNFTDPNVANATATYTTVSSVSGSAATISTGEWQTSGSSIYALSRNGILEYTLSISPSGVYRLELEGTQHNALTSQDDFEIQLYIDGSYCGQQTLTAPYGTNGTAHFFLPSLPVGDHTAKIIWKNIASETFLQINALRLQSITGTDSDSNGVADWVDSRLENMSKVELASTSKTSPVCAEGDNAQNLELMAISGYYTQSGETPVEPPVMHGANNKWFADVPISPDGTTNLTFSFQNGAETVQKTVTWLPTNAITDDDMTIRLNDSLRLTGYPTGNSAGTVSITVDGQTYNTAANTPVVHKFETAGTFTVNATFTPDGGGDPVTGQMDVKVVSSSFSGGATCYLNVARVWENPDLADESVLEADSHISFFAGDMDPTGKELDLLIKESKTGYIVARLGEDGPVMAATTVTPLVAKIPTGHFTIIDEFDDGSQLVECAIYVSEVPDDLRIYLRIFVAGITFDDGTIERWVTADDFDENGVYRYLFIRAEGAYTGNCHYIKFYQGDDYLNKYF
jgi:hypothetical protein